MDRVVVGAEDALQRVQRRRPDVAEDDAERADGQRGRAAGVERLVAVRPVPVVGRVLEPGSGKGSMAPLIFSLIFGGAGAAMLAVFLKFGFDG